MKRIFFFVFCLQLLFNSCSKEAKHPVDFYYWKSRVTIGDTEKEYFEKLNSKRLYIRFFDVDKEGSDIVPKSKVSLFDPHILNGAEYIPVVFITNRTFIDIDDSKVEWLADRTAKMIEMICERNGVKDVKEIQIDCDWTETTRNSYFRFLSLLKAKSLMEVSCTLRLHQIKYSETTGVPPVYKGVLMCYATSDPSDESGKNSILDIALLKDYTAKINSYPLNFDIALPLYSWAIVTNHLGKIKILNSVTPNDIDTLSFKIVGTNEYEAKEDLFFQDMYLNKGFRVKVEAITPELLDEAKTYLNNKIGRDYRIIYYHLDKPFLERFTIEQLN